MNYLKNSTLLKIKNMETERFIPHCMRGDGINPASYMPVPIGDWNELTLEQQTKIDNVNALRNKNVKEIAFKIIENVCNGLENTRVHKTIVLKNLDFEIESIFTRNGFNIWFETPKDLHSVITSEQIKFMLTGALETMGHKLDYVTCLKDNDNNFYSVFHLSVF